MYWGGVYWMFIIVAFVFRKDNMGHRLWKRRCTRKFVCAIGQFGFADGNGMMHIITSLPRSARKAEGFWRERRQVRTRCALAVATERKPDPFEPGGSGSLPKPPFQPLACALSSWAYLAWAAARASPPAALGQPWLPWRVQSLVKGVRGNYQRCQYPTSF